MPSMCSRAMRPGLAAQVVVVLASAAGAQVSISADSALPLPGGPGTGLDGSIWFAGVTNTTDAFSVTQGGPANAMFVASLLDYPRGGQTSLPASGTLADFLGNDAASVVGVDPTQRGSVANIFVFAGFIAVRSAGTYTLGVGSDDGFRLAVGGTAVSEQPGDRGFAYTNQQVSFSAPGLYPVNILYYANSAVESGLEFRWTVPDSTGFDLVPTASLYQVPAPGTVALGALVAAVALRRRR